MPDDKKVQDVEEVGVADRLTDREAHPAQTDASKPAPKPAKPTKG